MKQTIIGFHPKRKVANRINRLIKFLYNYGIKLSFDKRFSTKDKFALLEFDQKLRVITQELFDKFDDKTQIDDAIHQALFKEGNIFPETKEQIEEIIKRVDSKS